MIGGWQHIHDREFAHVYDADLVDRLDLSWDGELLMIEGDAKLDIDGVRNLRKLLQAIERKATR